MKTISSVFLLFSIALAPSFAGSHPSVTAWININEVDGYKEYNYTLVNDLDSGGSIYSFELLMPEAGARSIIDFDWSKPGWIGTISFRSDSSKFWTSALAGAAVGPLEQITFTFRTRADVPTAYDFSPATCPSNWAWYARDPDAVEFGISNLPVPVPESSSLAALGFGLAPLGAAVKLRWRKRS